MNVALVVSKKGDGEMSVLLDTTLTEELRNEGTARDLVRKVQMMRKEKGCRIDEQIALKLPNEHKQIGDKLIAYIQEKTLAHTLTWGDSMSISTG